MTENRYTSEDENIRYKRYRPEDYQPGMSIFWWASKKPYILFIIRELTSVFIAAYMVLVLIQLNALRQGPEAWESLRNSLSTPFSVGVHVLILLFVIFHSLTWFWIAPTALVFRIGGRRIQDAAIIMMNIFLWILFSLAIIWIFISI